MIYFNRIICILIGYIFGLFQTSYLYGRLKHIDIRNYGSGNAGTTNALRTLGKKAGIITFAGDILKPVAAMFICYLIFRESYPQSVNLLSLYAGAGAVLGHVFPAYLGFRGGKGIATLGGVAIWFTISIHTWYMLPISIIMFIIVVAITKYVSLGSLVMLFVYFIQLIVFGQLGYCKIDIPYIYECYAVFFVLIAISYYKHWSNIKRLATGKENKISFGKKTK